MPKQGATLAGSRRRAWEARVEWPGIVAASVYLLIYSFVVLVPDMSGAALGALTTVFFLIWACFIVDYLTRIALTPHGWRTDYFWHNKRELFSALLPILRPFVLLRKLQQLRGFRGRSGDSLRSRILVSALAYTVLFVYVISLTEYAVERDAQGATIKTFGNAIWWAIVTVATVGYGDYTPVTVPGRILAVILMLGGVAIIGTASATIVSYLNERTGRLHNPEQHEEDKAE
jgi:voltage-gated potassium channel